MGVPSARRLGGPGEGDCLAVVPPARPPARASALARTTSGSRGSGGRASRHGRSRGTFGRWIRIRSTVSHLPGQPPISGNRCGQPGPGGPALWGTVRIAAAVRRHPKVPAGWNIVARRPVTRRCYQAGQGAVSGDQAQLPGPRDGLGPVGGAELAQDVRHVFLTVSSATTRPWPMRWLDRPAASRRSTSSSRSVNRGHRHRAPHLAAFKPALLLVTAAAVPMC